MKTLFTSPESLAGRGDQLPGIGSGPAERPLALVVGAGFGGLAAAIRLSVMGYRVEVLEKLDGP